MPYFPVDDQAAFHPKFVMAGNAAIGLWTRAGSWSKNHATGGFIPAAIAGSMGTKTEIKKLVLVGLWEEVLGGYLFHDWDHYGANRTGAEEEAKREEKREIDRLRKQRQREREREESVTVTRDSHAMSRVTNGGENSVTSRDGHGVTDSVTSRARGPIPSPVPSVVDLDTSPSVPETSREYRTDIESATPAQIRAAAEMHVDFLKIAARVNAQAEEAVPAVIVERIIREAVQRAKPRNGDRTGLVLASVQRDWAEWSRLVFQVAS